jgi:hypothetical protein
MKKFLTSKKALSKMILMVAVVVIVVAVAASGVAIYLTQNPSAPNTNPTTNPSESSTPAPSASTGNGVATATSLKFSVSLTENGAVKGVYTFQGKNADTSNPSIRVDYTAGSDESTFIFNGAQHKAWTFSGNEWVDISSYYDQQFLTWNNLWKGYVSSLAAWTGAGDYSYTQNGETVRIYDIQVNSALADSLFEHT